MVCGRSSGREAGREEWREEGGGGGQGEDWKTRARSLWWGLARRKQRSGEGRER